MKKLLAFLLFWPLLLSAQTSYIQFLHFTAGYGNLTCNPTGSNYVATGNIGDGTAVITWASASNCWVVSGLSPAGVLISPANVWITNSAYWAYGDRYPTNGAVCQVFGDQSGLITNYLDGVSTLTFFNFVAPAVTNWATISTNYWSAPGDVVYFNASGRNMSVTNPNRLVVSIDGNPMFTGPYTAAGGFGWRVSGSVQWDGTNFLSTGQFLSGDTNTPVGYDTELFTNVAVGRNAWQWAVQGDTNGLTFDSAGILAARAPSGDLPQHSFVAGSSGAVVATIPTNVVLSSQQIVLFQSNTFAFTGSNFIARVPMVQSWKLITPQLGGGGMNPATNAFEQLSGSYSGTGGWFNLTNGFFTTNPISLAVSGVNGGTNTGIVQIFGVDHPELMGRTNYYFGQFNQFPTPVNPADAATKSYVDVAVLNNQSPMVLSVDTNNVSHLKYSWLTTTLLDIASSANYVHIDGFTDDGTLLAANLNVAQTNLAAGWVMQSSTNLSLVNGWTGFTNWVSVTTNSGEVSFKIAYNFAAPAYFRLLTIGVSTITASAPVVSLSGTIYPSNTWSLASITNAMSNFSFWSGNSNGQALITLSLSNGVVRYLQVLR